MAIIVAPYEPQHAAAAQALNERLRHGNGLYQLPESPHPKWLPPGAHDELYRQFFVAQEGEQLRGFFILKWESFRLRGRNERVALFQLPISEGIVDRAYGPVGTILLKEALRRSPYLCMLGIGGRSEPAARILTAMKWRLVDCPFFFHVVHPFRFLRGMAYLRQQRHRRLLLDIGACSGTGPLALKAMQWMRRSVRLPDHAVDTFDRFGEWADRLWAGARDHYTLIARRDASVLNVLYPADDPRFIRISVRSGGTTAGWAVLLNTPMKADKYFGDLRVGTVVDCLSARGCEAMVIAAARRTLAAASADVIVTNQLAEVWRQACVRNGFLEGPSNFIFAASPSLAAQLDPFDAAVSQVHMTRGDGEGPGEL